ncbi:hypothetical protein AAG906_022901 [Vitis piasezkii]
MKSMYHLLSKFSKWSFWILKNKDQEPIAMSRLGNHRDAWTYGAVDPNSGTAVLLDIARRYALMMRLGFFLGATPRLDNLLIEVAKKSMTIYDNWMITNKVINWILILLHFCNMQGFLLLIYTMEEGTCVLRHACIKETKHLHFKGVGMGVTHPEPALLPSLVLNKSAPVIAFALKFTSQLRFHANQFGKIELQLSFLLSFLIFQSTFDSYNWMTNHGDPLFQRHVAALHDDPILPFNYVSYTTIMGTATHRPFVSTLGNHSICELSCNNLFSWGGTTQISYATWVKGTVSLHPITASIQELTSAAEEAEGEASSSPYGQLDKEQ